MDYIEKLGLHRCEDCGTISNCVWWDGELTENGKTFKLEGLAKIDDPGETFELDDLIERLEEENGLDDYEGFSGEPNCPFCKSSNYWPLNVDDFKGIIKRED